MIQIEFYKNCKTYNTHIKKKFFGYNLAKIVPHHNGRFRQQIRSHRQAEFPEIRVWQIVFRMYSAIRERGYDTKTSHLYSEI